MSAVHKTPTLIKNDSAVNVQTMRTINEKVQNSSQKIIL